MSKIVKKKTVGLNKAAYLVCYSMEKFALNFNCSSTNW